MCVSGVLTAISLDYCRRAATFTVIESTSDYSPNPVYTLLPLSPFGKVPASLTLASTATTVQYGAAATITAHLGFTYGPPDFSVYQTPAGQPRPLGPTGSFRVRADFDASAKDTTNVSTDGSWVYYVVTK